MTEFVTLDGYVVRHATPRAVLLVKGTTEAWVPKSMCENGDELAAGDTDVSVAKWVAEREGLDATVTPATPSAKPANLLILHVLIGPLFSDTLTREAGKRFRSPV